MPPRVIPAIRPSNFVVDSVYYVNQSEGPNSIVIAP